MYINCHSYFSLNYGVMSVEALLSAAEAMGISHLALTDINNTSGCLDFLRLAPQHHITPIIGIEFRDDNERRFIGLARNNEGFRELNELLSIQRQQHIPPPEYAPSMPNCFIIYPWSKAFQHTLKDNEYIGVSPADVNSFRIYGKAFPQDKVLALPTASFRHKLDYNTHRLLRAIATNELLSKLEPHQHGSIDDQLHKPEKLQSIYEEMSYALENNEKLLKCCNVFFEFGKAKNKKYYTDNEQEDRELLIKLAEEGLKYRYPQANAIVRKRFDSELRTIISLGFTAYFLINWDIVRFARENEFYYIGRGSGANSIIAYCLLITDVDPIELDLYFERFINPSRKSPPDFDIDFSHTDRDIVRRYIFDKYGDKAALVGSYSTFERKSCIREIGKVFGLPPHEIEQLQNDQKAGSGASDQYGKLVLRYAALIHGLPNLLSVHACGILISELPITYYSALELMPVGFPSTQFSMLEAEDVGLHKYDILSQRGLGHIKDAVQLVKKKRGIDIDIHRIQDFKKDARIRHLLRVGDTLGCFYVESPAMRQLLRKLMVEDYHGLVAASSIIRPGVSSSGMMREYILRYRYPEKRKEAHPVMLQIMPDTFGVMVYQEDVIKVAHYYAGLTLEEADVMRRGMSGKFRSRAEFQNVRETFFRNCKKKNYPEAESAEIWRQIESFAGYSFAKGHSASYAVESYQSLYLRAYYPIEFMVGVINNFGGFYSTEFYLHEARMRGAMIELPCVNKSETLAVLEESSIYMGFCLIKDLETRTIQQILYARSLDGAFISLEDFIHRVSISLEQLRILIRINAFRFTGLSTKELLWTAHLSLSKIKKTVPKKELFAASKQQSVSDLPELEYDKEEQALNEMQILGFPFRNPFSLLIKQYKGIHADELSANLGKVIYIMGYYVSIKPVRTINGDLMYFGSFIDAKGLVFDTVHFPQSIARYPFTGKGCYLLKGKVVADFEVPSVEVSNMERVPWLFG